MFLGGGNLIYTLPQIALMAALAAEESTVDGVGGSSCWGLYNVYVCIFLEKCVVVVISYRVLLAVSDWYQLCQSILV